MSIQNTNLSRESFLYGFKEPEKKKPRKKKLAIVGAGLAGCITAMHYHLYGRNMQEKITIYHDPNVPIEETGQGTTPNIAGLIFIALDNSWYTHNKLGATKKFGISYEGFAKRDIFHTFAFNTVSCHYRPNLLTKMILESDLFDIVEKNIDDPESEIDSDWIFDCRGRTKNNPDDYESLTSPINAVLLATKPGKTDLEYTRSVATPDGWTFIIPNVDSTSYGYLYNNEITDTEIAKKNLREIFGVEPQNEISFDSYVAKDIWRGERTILNGNRVGFIEPMEASSAAFYKNIAEYSWDHIHGNVPKRFVSNRVRHTMKQIETFLLWHYAHGSKYDTPFWKHAKSLWEEHTPHGDFNKMVELCDKRNLLEHCVGTDLYAQWYTYSFKQWRDAYI